MKNYEDILGKFPHRGCLDFTINSKLRQLSKEIPEGLCGIYMYVLCNTDKEDILYIGCSGHIEKGEPVSKKKHGLRGRIYGKQEKTPRDKFYKEVMKEKGVSQYTLIKKYGISPAQITRLKRNESVSTHTIEMFCKILDCNVGDIMEYIKDSE